MSKVFTGIDVSKDFFNCIDESIKTLKSGRFNMDREGFESFKEIINRYHRKKFDIGRGIMKFNIYFRRYYLKKRQEVIQDIYTLLKKREYFCCSVH